jgi:hypothetical protein
MRVVGEAGVQRPGGPPNTRTTSSARAPATTPGTPPALNAPTYPTRTPPVGSAEKSDNGPSATYG